MPGVKNDDADWLSRGNQADELPLPWDLEFRIRCPVSAIWDCDRNVRLFPADARLT